MASHRHRDGVKMPSSHRHDDAVKLQPSRGRDRTRYHTLMGAIQTIAPLSKPRPAHLYLCAVSSPPNRQNAIWRFGARVRQNAKILPARHYHDLGLASLNRHLAVWCRLPPKRHLTIWRFGVLKPAGGGRRHPMQSRSGVWTRPTIVAHVWRLDTADICLAFGHGRQLSLMSGALDTADNCPSCPVQEVFGKIGNSDICPQCHAPEAVAE